MNDERNESKQNLNQTNAEKIITTSFISSMDFTDTGSEQNSSGMDTYILERDSETSESPRSTQNVVKNVSTRPMDINKFCEFTAFDRCSIIVQEIFTQTSKTIIDLARNDGVLVKSIDCNTMETQTSLISITENKTISYNIETMGINKTEFKDNNQNNIIDIACNQLLSQPLDDYSSKLLNTENKNESNTDKFTNILNPDTSDEMATDPTEYDSSSDFEHAYDTSDMEQDSLMEPNRCFSNSDNEKNEKCCDTPKSVDRDISELYAKLYGNKDYQSHTSYESQKSEYEHLTPLTEEPVTRENSAVGNFATNNVVEDNDILFINNAGVKVKLFCDDKKINSYVPKLPPIQSTHRVSNPGNLDYLFSINPNNSQLKPGPLHYVHEDKKVDNKVYDRWELSARELASGEGYFVNSTNDENKGNRGAVILPPIQFTSTVDQHHDTKVETVDIKSEFEIASDTQNDININDKIKELKMGEKDKFCSYRKIKITHKSDSRCLSPSEYTDISKMSSPAERGCDVLCLELLKRLRLASWPDVVTVLKDIPSQLEKFWSVISDNRIADLLRQITGIIESPRTQVARTACSTLAAILRNTNYTKKPEFFESMTILLAKTGSFSRPVRRAANVALDDIVCGVELSQSVTAICIHGVTHKSGLVRSASARLLVVCCALGGGGRELLRARPPTAACARKHTLRALAVLLEDKSSEARKYAERLYSMLRPLSSFEAYYITDLDVQVASRQIKKYDQLLLGGSTEPR